MTLTRYESLEIMVERKKKPVKKKQTNVNV